ncbi:MAG: T9SS type A sorting domain-containing protein, partial [Chitinophagales bacterium]
DADYWIVKTDAGGVKQWDARFGGSDNDALFSLQQTANGEYILGGSSYSGISGDKTQASQGYFDYWIVKTDADVATGTMLANEDFFSEIYPNPVQNQLTIKLPTVGREVTLQVYDLQGKMIDLPITIQNTQAQINTTALPEGFYTLQITNNKTGTSEVRKFVKQ